MVERDHHPTEVRRRITEIDAAIDALIEDGVDASSSRVRALRAKKSVLLDPDAQRRSMLGTATLRTGAPRRGTTGTRREKTPEARIKPVGIVAELLAGKVRAPQKSKAEASAHRRAIDNALKTVNSLRKVGLPRTVAEADVMLADVQSAIVSRLDDKRDYPQKMRSVHGDQRRAIKEVRQALKWRRRTAPVDAADLADILYAWALREVVRRRSMPADTVGVVGIIQVRSGGAPSLGRRK